MNNLKRVLSLALASVMIIGMMVIGASATTISFTDEADIENTTAVNTAVALKIINGKPDGKYDPTGDVTRAEMAKMIFMAYNGGNDISNLTKNSTPIFTDVPEGYWARGYIEYINNLGFIAGLGDGTFNPEGKVTAQEAAKMLLTALGYDSKTEGFEGTADWALNINTRAAQKKLYAGVNKDTSFNPADKISRDEAAQIIYNALTAKTVSYSSGSTVVVINNGDVSADKGTASDNTTTLLAEKYDVTENDLYIQTITYSNTTGKYTYTLAAAVASGTKYTVQTTDDYTALYGQPVVVLGKLPSTAGAITNFQGLYSAGADVLEATWGEVTGATATGTTTSFKVDGVSKTVSTTNVSSLVVYVAADTTTGDTTLGAVSASEVANIKFVDDNGDGKFEYAILDGTDMKQVTYLNAAKTTATIGATVDLTKADVYEGIAKDDWVLYSKDPVTGKETIKKADTVSGKVTAVKDTNTVQIDGAWYVPAAANTGKKLAAAAINGGYELVVNGGFYWDNKSTDTVAASTDLLYISAVSTLSSDALNGTNTVRARAYFTDGTNDIIVINSLNGSKLESTGYTVTDVASGEFDKTKYETAKNLISGALYTYTKDNDGYYNVSILSSENKAGYDSYASAASSVSVASGKLTNGTAINITDDAVFFVQITNSGSETVKVVKGSDVKLWGSTAWGTSGQVLASTVSGYDYAKVATLISTSATAIPGDDTTSYGYVTSAPYITKDANGTTVAAMTVWTADGSKDILVASFSTGTAIDGTAGQLTSANGLATGCYISFKYNSAGNAINVTPYGAKFAVSALAGSNLKLVKDGNTAATQTEYTVNGATTYIYVDTAEGKGVEEGSLQQATPVAGLTGFYLNNVVVDDTNAALAVVFVDVNNNIDAGGGSLGFTANAVIADATIAETTTNGVYGSSATDSSVTVANVGSETIANVLGAKTVFSNVLSIRYWDVDSGSGAFVTSGTSAANDYLEIVTTNGNIYHLFLK